MKTSKKILLIFAVICVIGGAVITLAAINREGFNFSEFGNEGDYTEKIYNYENSEINQIIIEDLNRDVVLVPSNDDKVNITTMENEDEYYEISMTDDGNLNIKFKEDHKWFEIFDFVFNFQDKILKVEVPSQIYGNVNVKSTSGDIKISDLKILGELKLKIVSGDIKANNLTVGDNVLMETVSGEINSFGVIVSGNMEVYTTSGDLDINDVISLKDITLKTVSGEIDFSGIQGLEITLKTVSGDISGTLIGDPDTYTIEAKTTSGDINVPKSKEGNYEINAKTTSGDIDIDFE